MAAGTSRKISAASARAHTRRAKQSSSFKIPSGIFTAILAILIMGISAWVYQAIQPPPPKICGSAGGPSVTAPRIKLRDGRQLAYKEHGVLKEKAQYKIVFIHGADCYRNDPLVAALSPDIIEDLAVYTVSFDRPGYGESDPNPKQTVKSDALDVEELADQLGLGSKFFVIGTSMGGKTVWSCLKYIPHRLAGAALLAPVVNYWWPGFPSNLSKEAFYQQLPRDQWALRIAHYIPWLTYWWNTQKLFPVHSVIARRYDTFSRQDIEMITKFYTSNDYAAQVRQQGDYESLHRDLMVAFGTWEFDPTDLDNPFPNGEVSVHLWQGDEDGIVPVTLQRYVAKRLPWVRYHEVRGGGHGFPFADGMCNTIVKTLLTGDS